MNKNAIESGKSRKKRWIRKTFFVCRVSKLAKRNPDIIKNNWTPNRPNHKPVVCTKTTPSIAKVRARSTPRFLLFNLEYLRLATDNLPANLYSTQNYLFQ